MPFIVWILHLAPTFKLLPQGRFSCRIHCHICHMFIVVCKSSSLSTLLFVWFRNIFEMNYCLLISTLNTLYHKPSDTLSYHMVVLPQTLLYKIGAWIWESHHLRDNTFCLYYSLLILTLDFYFENFSMSPSDVMTELCELAICHYCMNVTPCCK